MNKAISGLAGLFGYKLVRKHRAELVYMHEYQGGYDQYRETQIFHNKRKLEAVWADEATLTAIRDFLRQSSPEGSLTGICHGARNGFEVEWLRRELDGETIGTDISETATQFPHMEVWDFHDDNPAWHDRFDFVYTNSLDQAMQPRKALAAWAQQIKRDGFIFIEHTMDHSAEGAGEMDPFGAHPMCMPYLFFEWGRDKYALTEILKVEKSNKRMPAWVFVLKRTDADSA